MIALEKTLNSLCPLGYNAFKEYKPHKNAKRLISNILHLDSLCHNIRISYTWLERKQQGFSVAWELPDISFEYEWSTGIEDIFFHPVSIEIMPNFMYVNKLDELIPTGLTPHDKTLFVFLSFEREYFENIKNTKFENILVFDEEAILYSEKVKQLVLNCYYKYPVFLNGKYEFKWCSQLLIASDLYLNPKIR